MDKLDITKHNLSVIDFPEARNGVLPRKFIPFQKPRPSDGLVYILCGSCRYTFNDGTSFEAHKDGILYLAKDAVYQMDVNCDKYEFMVVNFNFNCDTPRKSAFYTPLSPAAVQRCFSRLCYGRTTSTPTDFARNMGILYRIIEIVNESAERVYISGSARLKIEKSADAIHESFASEVLSVSALAKDAGMSEVYFRKLFHLRFGMSPSHYIMQTRISHAVKLMQLERLSLDEISEKSGFSSLPYFSKVFKAMMGESPAKYRNTLPKLREMT